MVDFNSNIVSDGVFTDEDFIYGIMIWRSSSAILIIFPQKMVYFPYCEPSMNGHPQAKGVQSHKVG